MEKFTKGEWAIMPAESDKEYIRIRGTVLGGKFKIANVSDLKNHHEDGKKWCAFERSESEANAHLIAAAPEMYAMLSALSGQLESEWPQDAKIFLNDIDALLAKARGEL